MASIDARIAALMEAVERRKMEQEAPIDPLSRSLFEYADWLGGLDETGKLELLEEWNKDRQCMTMEALEDHIASFAEERGRL